MKTLLLTSAAAVVMGGTAYAADLYTPPMVEEVVVAPAPAPFNWTGIHFGVDVGGQFDFTDSYTEAYNYIEVGPRPNLYTDSSANLGAENWFLSGDIGADVQLGGIVLGVFANYDYHPNESTASHDAYWENFYCDDCYSTYVANTVTYGDAWGVGARAGVLVNPKALLYVLGGYGQKEISAQSEFEFYYSQDGIFPAEYLTGGLSGGGWRPGWFVGAGLEAAVGKHFTVAAEYRYANYDGFSMECDETCAQSLFGFPLDYHEFDVGNTNSHTIRARLSFWLN